MDAERTKKDLNGKSILVTGGTGSFGRACIRRLLEEYDTDRLIVFSRDELKQFEMQGDPAYQDPRIRFFIGDVRDVERLELALREVDYVIHAAAMKQVPTAEYNPFECVMTNIHGAENVVKAAIRTSVTRVIGLSTDKAANPINLYGASKLASDKIFIAGNNLSGEAGVRFSVVRYGNVLGSRGSVVQVYRRLLSESVPKLPVTDARMTRFWILLEQGVDFVLSSLTGMHGGEIFVPKLPSARIVDLVEAMAPGTPVEEIGIRPGEKLHEVLITEDDARTTLELEDRFLIAPQFSWWTDRDFFPYEGKPVAAGFRYASDTNPHTMDAGQLRRMIADAGV